jgi:hypothetical protein
MREPMKRTLHSAVLTLAVIFSAAYSCHSQNGPTLPTAVLTWTNPANPGLTANCVYRSTGAGSVPAPPAIFCSKTPVLTYTDTTVAGATTYNYAVTAQIGTAEGAYSNVEPAVVPAQPGAPVQNAPTVTKNEESKGPNLETKVVWLHVPQDGKFYIWTPGPKDK